MRTSCAIPAMGLVATLLMGVVLPCADAARNPARAEAAPPPPYNLLPQEWYRSLLVRGHASEEIGQKLDALADYTLVIESHAFTGDEQARVLFDRGLLLDGMNRLDEALSDYSIALSLTPNFAVAMNNRGNVYRRLGRLPEARRDYQASLAGGNPQSQYSYFGLGQIAEAQGDNTGAQEFYDRALTADPQYGLAKERLTALASNEGVLHPHQPVALGEPASALDGPTATAVVASQAGPMPATQQPTQQSLEVPPVTDDGGGNLRPAILSSDDNGHSHQVQLGAWRSKEEAAQGWDRALGRAGDALRGLSPRIVQVDLPAAGRFYRLRVSAGQAGPKGFCAALAARGQDCIPARD